MSRSDQPIHPPSEDLFAYRDGELDPDKRAFVEAHVMGCSVCRSFIDQVSSLEAELRQSPDRAPAEYLERLHESVRARIASAEGAGASEPAAAGASRSGVLRERRGPGRWSGRERRGDAVGGAGEDGRIKEAPKLAWAAILSTASAAAAVLVVVGLLIKQGFVQHPLLTKEPSTVSQAPPEEAEGDRGAGTGLEARRKSAEQDKRVPGARGKEKLEAESKDGLATPGGLADLKASENAPTDEVQPAPTSAAPAPPAAQGSTAAPGSTAAGNLSSGETSQKREAPAAKSIAPERQEELLKTSPAPEARADEAAAGSRYEALVRHLGIPPVWDGASVTPEALERAEPELRSLYVSGGAGADSARVRLYLAEAARLRYKPGDLDLLDEVVHHYRRAIALAHGDAETARVAAERLHTLQR